MSNLNTHLALKGLFTFGIALAFGITSMAAQNITGSGTPGDIAKFTGAQTIGNSVITENASKIGIGTGAPTSKLTVLGSASNPIIFGKNSGSGPGIRGESIGGFGMIGQSGRTGVQGISTGSVGNGVWGNSSADTGVYGSTATGTGVRGHASNNQGVGVLGDSPGGYGVEGSSPGGTAIYGHGILGVYGQGNNGGSGVYGNSGSGVGVYGQSTGGDGVFGTSTNGTGVHGMASGVGVFGEAGSYGVIARGSVGIYAAPTTGNTVAGLFGGNVQVQGNLTKSSGSFKIDHPLDPANKYLYHSFVESPDMKNIYDGTVKLDNKGEAVVSMPEYFSALNQDFRYQLTAIGKAAPNLHIARKIADNQFKIGGGKPGMEVSWQVTGIRHDVYAKNHRITVEEDKGKERGYYIYPAGFNEPPEKSLESFALRKQSNFDIRTVSSP